MVKDFNALSCSFLDDGKNKTLDQTLFSSN